MSLQDNHEVELLLNIVRGELDNRGEDALDGVDGVDWNQLVALAIEHDVGGLLCSAFRRTPAGCIPEEIYQAADAHLNYHRQQNTRSLELLRELGELLESAGVSIIPFKGPMLSRRLYDDLALRSFKDLDFLVPDDQIQVTLDCLNARGYQEDIPPLSPAQLAHYRYYNGQAILFGDSLPIEPHWSIVPRVLMIRLDHESLWERSENTAIGTWPTRQLAVEDMLIALCIHGGKELWGTLKWIVDIAVLLRRNHDLKWEELHRRSRAWGTLRMVLLGLTLAQRFFDAPLPKQVRQWIDDDASVDALARYVAELLFAHDKSSHPAKYTLNGYNLRLRDTNLDRLRFAIATTFVPRNGYFQPYKIPDRLFALYYLIKPLHDVALLPLWKLQKRIRGS
ncbi:MAG: nucleotidyltransferase family protein [Pseudomonadota bacterium]